MQVSTENRTFSEITEMSQSMFISTPNKPKENVDMPVVVTGPKAELLRLQEDLRKRGYKKAR